jgi:nucleoid-associated protein YgaU
MRLTRLHLFLGLILLVTTVLYVIQYNQKRAKKPVEKVIPVPAKVEPVVKEEVDKKAETLARKTIAIAGEYWKIARKESRDLSRGQVTLRRAKEEFRKKNYDEAVKLAKRSIGELKTAPRLETRYTVCRGDNLWNIAKMEKHYGRGSFWVKIWRKNEKSIPDFDLVYRGQKLIIPK